MFPLVESIRIVHRQPCLSSLHNKRANYARRALLNINEEIDLCDYINLDDIKDDKRYKCRITYGETVGAVEVTPYLVRPIDKVALCNADHVTYHHKMVHRHALDVLRSENLGFDEIIMVKDGFLTDAYYYNIVLNIGGILFTPQSPLLHGVMRQHLIDEEIIIPKALVVEDIDSATEIHFINAMTDIGEAVVSDGVVMQMKLL